MWGRNLVVLLAEMWGPEDILTQHFKSLQIYPHIAPLLLKYSLNALRLTAEKNQ